MENEKKQAALGEEELLTVNGGVDANVIMIGEPRYQVGQRIKVKSPFLFSEPYVEGVVVEVTDFYLATRGRAYWVEFDRDGKMERVEIYEGDIVGLC